MPDSPDRPPEEIYASVALHRGRSNATGLRPVDLFDVGFSEIPCAVDPAAVDFDMRIALCFLNPRRGGHLVHVEVVNLNGETVGGLRLEPVELMHREVHQTRFHEVRGLVLPVGEFTLFVLVDGVRRGAAPIRLSRVPSSA